MIGFGSPAGRARGSDVSVLMRFPPVWHSSFQWIITQNRAAKFPRDLAIRAPGCLRHESFMRFAANRDEVSSAGGSRRESSQFAALNFRMQTRFVRRRIRVGSLAKAVFSYFLLCAIRILAAPAVACRSAAVSDLPKIRVVARCAAMRSCFAHSRLH